MRDKPLCLNEPRHEEVGCLAKICQPPARSLTVAARQTLLTQVRRHPPHQQAATTVCFWPMAKPQEVVILGNPYSGKGANRQRVEALTRALADKGLSAKQVWDLDERRQLLSDPTLGHRYRCVVSAGGDGSMAGVVNDLGQGGATSRTPIAMLPLGNENLFAKAFGHNKGVAHLAEAIDRLATRTIDVGQANETLFTLMASAGFDSEVVQRVDAWRRSSQDRGLKRVSRVSYAKPILSALRTYRYPQVTLTADGQRIDGAHAFVFNIGKYGGGLPIASQANDCDGLLDWVVFKKAGLIKLARYGLWTYLRRHLKHSEIAHGKSTNITLACETGAMPVQADGDPCVQTPVTIRVRPKAMQVVLA